MNDEKRGEFLGKIAALGGEASMWEVGEALGLDRARIEALAIELMGEGALEMVNLSGGVKLTEAARLNTGPGEAVGGLGEDSLQDWLADLARAGDLGLRAGAATDLEADAACLKAQAKRSKPLGVVVRTCLEAAAQGLSTGNSSALALASRASALR